MYMELIAETFPRDETVRHVLMQMARFAFDAGHENDKALATQISAPLASLSEAWANSSVASFADGAFGLVISEDKLGRKDVEQAVPALDLRTGEPLAWAPDFCACAHRPQVLRLELGEVGREGGRPQLPLPLC